jgi:competence protein ComFC
VGPLAYVLDVVLPERCAVCGFGEEALCRGCRSLLRRLTAPLCARCGAPTAWPVERCIECAGRRLSFAEARAAVAYDAPARALVAAWKERGRRRLAAELASLVAEVVPRPDADAITFVPGDPDRTRWRGQNPAEALALHLAGRWSLPLASLLARARTVRRQRGLARSERRANVRGAFAARAEAPARLVLVDDVYTTGATVAAAAGELRRAGSRVVHVVAFARAVRG